MYQEIFRLLQHNLVGIILKRIRDISAEGRGNVTRRLVLELEDERQTLAECLFFLFFQVKLHDCMLSEGIGWGKRKEWIPPRCYGPVETWTPMDRPCGPPFTVPGPTSNSVDHHMAAGPAADPVPDADGRWRSRWRS
jgi:hypothetical protein